jgi:hypothetical protein
MSAKRRFIRRVKKVKEKFHLIFHSPKRKYKELREAWYKKSREGSISDYEILDWMDDRDSFPPSSRFSEIIDFKEKA